MEKEKKKKKIVTKQTDTIVICVHFISYWNFFSPIIGTINKQTQKIMLR